MSFDAAWTLASDLDIQFRTTDQLLTFDDLMKDGGIDALWFITYDQLGQWILPEEMKDLSVWIGACLPAME